MKKFLWALFSILTLAFSISGLISYCNYQTEIEKTVVNPLNHSASLVFLDLEKSYEIFKEVQKTAVLLVEDNNTFFSRVVLIKLSKIESYYVHILFEESEDKSKILLKQTLIENLEKLAKEVDKSDSKNNWFAFYYVSSFVSFLLFIISLLIYDVKRIDW